MKCPSCNEPLLNSKKCECGWKKSPQSQEVDPHHGKCSWSKNGIRCDRVGTISPMTGAGDLFCSWHYECFTKNLDGSLTSQEYQHFLDMEESLEKCARKHEKEVSWDTNDMYQIKGLMFLGVTHPAWKAAPEIMRDAARHVLKNGWPKSLQKQKGVTT